LPELAPDASPAPDVLRHGVLRSLTRPELGLRLLVEDVLGQASRIDAVALDGRGHVVAILIGTDRHDAALLTRGLAARAWLADRIGDWAKLAPELKLRDGAPVRALILAPAFAPETRSAVESLPRGLVDCVAFRSIRVGAQLEVLLDLPGRSHEASTTAPQPAATTARRPRFRSGLSDADLGLSAEEREHFERED